jgi:hypothetical protein
LYSRRKSIQEAPFGVIDRHIIVSKPLILLNDTCTLDGVMDLAIFGESISKEKNIRSMRETSAGSDVELRRSYIHQSLRTKGGKWTYCSISGTPVAAC